MPRPGCRTCQDPGVMQCPSVSPYFLSAFRCFLSARMRIYYNVSLLSGFSSSLKNMFFNTFVNQRLIKMFKRNSKKIPLYIWRVYYKVLLLHPLSRTGAAMYWHSDRNGVGTLTYFFCLGLVSFWNSPFWKSRMKKKLPEIFGRYEIKFLPLHPLSKSKQRWLTHFFLNPGR